MTFSMISNLMKNKIHLRHFKAQSVQCYWDSRVFSQLHSVGNVGIIVNFVFKYIHSYLLYLQQLMSVKLEIRNQAIHWDYISGSHALLE